jgi:hypothetical protein
MDLHWLDFLQKISAPVGVVVGAACVLMNYVRGRTHVPRLQVEVEAEVVGSATRRFVRTTVRVKNVGLAMITLPRSEGNGVGPRGCALLMTPLREHRPVPDLFDADWDDIRAFDILEYHRTIEPGLTINQQKLICLPDTMHDAYFVRVRVLAHAQSWSAVAIAINDTPPGDTPG